MFRDFHNKVEREKGRQLKCVLADNDGEYRGLFESYCKLHGIILEKTIPKTPQENRVAERTNRSITERVRCMLSNVKLPKSFWAEAMRTAVDLINLSPSVPLDGAIPERVWRGKDVSFKHLRVFGYRAFVHIPGDERSKLDVKSRLYNPVDKKVIRSRDVVFLEDHIFEEKDKATEKPRPSSDMPDSPDPVIVQENSNQGGVEEAQEEVSRNEDESVVDEPELSIQLPPPQPLQDEPRRSTRERKQSTGYDPNEYVLLTDGGELESFSEALAHEKKEEWLQAMQEEIVSLQENHT